jgi:hypothetical protein
VGIYVCIGFGPIGSLDREKCYKTLLFRAVCTKKTISSHLSKWSPGTVLLNLFCCRSRGIEGVCEVFVGRGYVMMGMQMEENRNNVIIEGFLFSLSLLDTQQRMQHVTPF